PYNIPQCIDNFSEFCIIAPHQVTSDAGLAFTNLLLSKGIVAILKKPGSAGNTARPGQSPEFVSFVAKLKFLPLGNGEFPRGTHFLTTEEVAENESRKDGC
uniref:hypothetical protein n=1 Tax=Prevotella sp. TaxID=59823 RepID=UPI003FEF396F